MRRRCMIKKYLIEKRSWIILFIILHMLFILIAYIDPTIPFTSLMYIIFLSFIIFIVFFIIRYHKETRFYKKIEDNYNLYELPNNMNADRPFEKMTEEHIRSEEHTSELQSRGHLVCRLLL